METTYFQATPCGLILRWLCPTLPVFYIDLSSLLKKKPARHADFQTTHRFYLAVREDHRKRARAVTTQARASHFGAHWARAHDSGESGLTEPTGRRYDCGT